MELTGDLSDFPLTDILQILALSRKTGTLALEAGVMNGRIVIEQGRITQASLRPGGTFADRLIQESVVTSDVLGDLRRVGGGETDVWTLETLLVESGVMTTREVELAAKRHIQHVVAALVCLERGRFGIALNQAGFQDAMTDVRLDEGLDIGEVLLEAATERDEGSRSGVEHLAMGLRELLESDERPSQGFEGEMHGDRSGGVMASPPSPRTWSHGTSNDDDRSLYSFLAELRSHSFEAEVSLLIMRYASEVVSRGVLFVVKEAEICGLGQFGIDIDGPDHRNADERVREITIPLGGKSLFDNVVRRGEPFIGRIAESYWHTQMLSHIGGNGRDLIGFALPIMCNDKPVFILYGDNYPDMRELVGIDALVTLVNQASIVLEKIVLERVVRGFQANNGNHTLKDE
ncbi:MAG TPA: DUF4388 domain-containing protein [Blastocatellia bacterium]|jgi:hypothetical protein|nr:DUF4388 domain-containing protein [Blastocatellia bacterium]